jgi:hypothetical protein
MGPSSEIRDIIVNWFKAAAAGDARVSRKTESHALEVRKTSAVLR